MKATLRFITYFTILLSVIISSSYAKGDKHIFAGPSPWPEIRQERLKTLLPYALKEANVDAWLVVCRENNNDPMAKHIGCENAGKTAVFIFYLSQANQASNEPSKNNKQINYRQTTVHFNSVAFSPIGEAKALKDTNVVSKVIEVGRMQSAIVLAADFVRSQNFERIAINISDSDPQADGLSYTQFKALSSALGAAESDKLVSAERLIYEFLAVKLPQEVDIMTKAAKLTAQWQIEAYKQIIPGTTTDADVARFLKQKMQEYGVGDAWAPSQNPNVVSGTDRGHSHATDRVIQEGDVIQTDFGIRVYDTWVTDIQRFAYVLREGEIEAPEDIAYYWDSAKKGRDAAFNAMRSGATGYDVDLAQRKVMQARESLPVMWSTGHPVGYVAHDSGPALNSKSNNPSNQLPLKPNMTFAFDGFYKWIMPNGDPKTISVEEMVVITDAGAKYLIPPQLDLILVD